MTTTIPSLQTEILLDAALGYAARGWPVLPLESIADTREGRRCTCARARHGEACTSAGKHPRYDRQLLPHGKRSASADPEVIRRWWGRWPQANIGVCAGRDAGIVILDIDPRSGGFASLEALQAAHGVFPETLTATTGSGGTHYVFQHPGGGPLSGGANKFGVPGVDCKGDDGYIVAAPSLHLSGERYRWENPDAPIAPLPAWILQTLTTGRPAAPTGGHSVPPWPKGGDKVSPPPASEGDAPTAPFPPRSTPLAERLVVGHRNDTLFRELCGMQAHGMSDTAIIAAAHSINREMCQPPLSDAEVDTLVRHVLETYAKPIHPYPHTDLGNAERLVHRYGDDLRWCDAAGGWHVWDGCRWQVDALLQTRMRAHDTARAIMREAADMQDKKAREEAIKWARASESRRATEAMLEQAKPRLACRPEVFDADPWWLNCRNGVVDLRTGELLPHDRTRYQRKCVATHYDPDAKCLHWFRFLYTTFGGDAQMMLFLQRAIGYTLTGDTSMQCLFFLYGGGANGKSTFVETMAALFADYQAKCPTSLLMQQRHDDGGGATPEIAALAGVRFAHAAEIERGSRLAESRVKDLTGGDTITARHLFRAPFTFAPSHKLWMYGNDKPTIRGTDDGIWRRLHLIPFLHQVPEADRRADLREACLLPELPGILAWAVDGCRDWLERGRKLDPPAGVLAATSEYRSEMDTFAEFLADCCTVAPHASASASALYQTYTAWAQADGQARPMTGTAFGRELVRREFKKKHTQYGKWYYGIGIREDEQY